MKSPYSIVPIAIPPGIQRDNTAYASKACIDGQWVRWYEGVPYKIGGFSLITPGTLDDVILSPVNDIFDINNDTTVTILLGRSDGVNYFDMDLNANALPETALTFVPAIIPNDNNAWSFDISTSQSATKNNAQLVIQVAPRGIDIANQVEGPVYVGNVSDLTTTFTQALLEDVFLPDPPNPPSTPTPFAVSGGVVFIAPFMLAYGNDGIVYYTDDPTRWYQAPQVQSTPTGLLAGSFVAANTKIVKIIAIRGSAQPTALIWSLDTLSLAVFGGLNSQNVPFWSVQTIEKNISIISPETVVQYDQTVFWTGIDQFYTYTGIVKRLPNTMNNDWFFKHVNYQARGACWAMAIPRFSEIWFFYPRLNFTGPNPTYCTDVVILNVQDNSWYDTPLARSCGIPASVFPLPIMCSSTLEVVPNVGDTYPIWRHEYGTDKVLYGNTFAIQSFFETNQIDLWSGQSDNAFLIYNRRIAPDFVMNGTMTVSILRQDYPQSRIFQEGPFSFGGDTEFIDFSSQGAIISFRFESNITGGFYQMGKPLFFYNVGDTLK